MDRQSIIIAAIAVVVLVAVGAFVLWPEGSEQAAVVTTQPAAEGSAASTGSGGY